MESDNNEDNISLRVWINRKKRIRPTDMHSDKENIRPTCINKQRQATSHWILWNKLLSELSSTFKRVTFSKSEFLTGTPISDTRYKHFENQNNNPFYSFNGQHDYTLAHYLANLETTKCNFYKFLTNLLMKHNTQNLLYHNTNKLIEKVFTILWEVPDSK